MDCSGIELNMAILQIGGGIGLDNIDKNIARLFPIQLRIALLDFFNSVFRLVYPNEWSHQILRPEVKNRHTLKKPKLRDIAISSLLPTLYDIMLDNRFKCWYQINPQQAGFREKQGCIIQLFAIYLLIELANSVNESIFIGFIDYEKAFDYTSRFQIVKDLMIKNAGSAFTRAISNMYHSTY